MNHRRTLAACLAAGLAAFACRAPEPAPAPTGPAGTLLLIGGGLDDDNRPVFERFLELAAAHAPPHVVLVTAASGDQETMATGKIAALQTWLPGLPCAVVRRETPTEDTVRAIDAATALFFTGGDQARIVARYRPGDAPTPEWHAMSRLLARGGVIAGSSAGLAMMGDTMLLGGDSAAALGVPQPPRDDGSPVPLGPRIGPGMRFLPRVVTDSHFFERNRLGRLVVAIEAAGERLGLGVGEDGCVEVDLGTGVATSIAVADSLLIDIAGQERHGAGRRHATAILLRQGERIDLRARAAAVPSPRSRPPVVPPTIECTVEEGQNRQLASWRLFARAAAGGSVRLPFDGWSATAWTDAQGELRFDLETSVPPGR